MSEKKKSLRASLMALAAKVGGKVFTILVKLLKGIKFTKVGLAALSFAGYAAILSWKFALMIMVALFVHESGHVWAMKRVGIKTKGFYFLPFLGGAAIAEEKFKTYSQQAFVAIMGPIWGGALALVAAGVYLLTHNPLFIVVATWIATFNLFNLLPVNPLDGGQILKTIAFSIRKGRGTLLLVVSTLIGSVILFKMHIGLIAILLIIGILEVGVESYFRFKPSKYRGELIVFPDPLTKKQLALTIGSYVLLIGLLCALVISFKHIPGADLAANFLE